MTLPASVPVGFHADVPEISALQDAANGILDALNGVTPITAALELDGNVTFGGSVMAESQVVLQAGLEVVDNAQFDNDVTVTGGITVAFLSYSSRQIAGASGTTLDGSAYVAHTGLTGAVTDTLPAATSLTGGRIIIKDEDGSASAIKTITLAGSGGNTIDGAATKVVINVAFGSKTVYSNGTNWLTM